MTLQQMYYITQVARYRSYSEAAKALFVSQSTLSLAIKDAETELHISIFDRSNKGIELTEEGTDFLTRIQDILDRSKNLEEYYLHRQLLGMRFSVSAQRLAFSVRAFNRLPRPFNRFRVVVRHKNSPLSIAVDLPSAWDG